MKIRFFKKNSYSIYNFIILILVGSFFLISTINNKTITPSWFTNNYLPWSNNIEKKDLDSFEYKHRGHDQIMQFFFERFDDAQTGYNQNKYSINWQMGLPKDARAQISNFTQKYFYNYFSENKLYTNNLANIQIATNLSTLVSFIICFLLAQTILNKIFNKSIENIFFSLLINPVFFLPSEEAWQMAIIAVYCFIYSFLILKDVKNKIRIKEIFQVLFFCFFSGHLFINSMSFHYWLYPLVTGIFFSFFILKKLGLKFLWLTIGFFLAAIINASLIIETINSLNLSPSKLEVNNVLSNIQQMEYAAIPFGYFIPNIIFIDILELLKLNFWPLNAVIVTGEGFWGFTLLTLSILSFFKIKDITLKFGIILCFLYWSGPLQLLLRIVLGGPFLTETSTGGRFGGLIYILTNFLLIFSYYLIKNDKISLPKFLSKLNLAIIFFVCAQLIYFYHKNIFWFFGFAYLTSLFLLQIYIKKKIIFVLFLSIIFLPFYNTIFKYGKNSIYPNNPTILNQKIFLNNNFNKNSVGVIASSYTKKKYIKKPIHSNFLILHNIRSLNGFVTPTNKYFQVLYNYQWITNWTDEEVNYFLKPQKNYDENNLVNKLKNYLNKKKITSKNLENYEYILKQSHRHYTFPIPLKKNRFSKTTENFFDLVGVNYIFTDDKVDLEGNYSILKDENKIKIWSRNKPTKYSRLLCNYQQDLYNISSVKKLLSNKFDFDKSVIIYSKINFNKCKDGTVLLETKINKQKKYFFSATISNPGGILFTNFVWNNNLNAIDQNNKNLKTMICNVSFTCIVPSIDSKKIYLEYKKPTLISFLKKKLNFDLF